MLLKTKEALIISSKNSKAEQSHLSTFSNIKQLTLSLKSVLDRADSFEDIEEIKDILSKNISILDCNLICEIYLKIDNINQKLYHIGKTDRVKIENIVELLIKNIRFYLRQAMDLGNITKNQDFYLFGIYD
jgi:hypothetical protein